MVARVPVTPSWSPASTARLCRAARSCDIVHLHDSLYLGNVVAFLRARVAGKPTLVTQHVGMVPYRQSLLRGLLATANRTLGRFVLGGASQAIFVSHKVREYFRRFVHFQADPLWIPNGLATETFFPATPDERCRLRKELGWPGDRPVFLFVGRFMEKKGLSLVLALAARFPDCQWVTIGWGPDDPSRWPLANVRSLGRMDHAAHCSLLPRGRSVGAAVGRRRVSVGGAGVDGLRHARADLGGHGPGIAGDRADVRCLAAG